MLSPKKETAEKVEREHRHLDKEMAELKTAAMKDVSPQEFPKWRLEFVWQLRDFKNMLLKHFDLEEEGGFMKDVLREAPHSERTVKHLKDEHGEFALQIDGIMAEIKTMQKKNPTELEKIRNALDQLFELLKRHEEEEHRLLQRTYFREYGGPS